MKYPVTEIETSIGNRVGCLENMNMSVFVEKMEVILGPALKKETV